MIDHDAAWHAERNTRIGGSTIGVLLGLSPWESPYSLWAKYTGLIPNGGDDPSPRLRIGRRMESVIAAEFHDETGLWIAGEHAMLRHPERAEFGCEVDGFVVESPQSDITDALGVFEAKTDSRFGWDEIPPTYLAQCRWNCYVAGLERAWLVVMFAGFRVEVFHVEQDPADVAFMVERADEFWRLVQTNTPPPLDGSEPTARAIGARWPAHDPGLVHDADAELVELLAKRAALKVRTRADELAIAECDNAIAGTIGDAELIAVDGVPAWSYKAQSSPRVDTKALRAAHPEIAARYTKTSSFRVLRALNTKGDR
jgi:putative phage-type endonuclease